MSEGTSTPEEAIPQEVINQAEVVPVAGKVKVSSGLKAADPSISVDVSNLTPEETVKAFQDTEAPPTKLTNFVRGIFKKSAF